VSLLLEIVFQNIQQVLVVLNDEYLAASHKHKYRANFSTQQLAGGAIFILQYMLVVINLIGDAGRSP
jgi:hypothetical protein